MSLEAKNKRFMFLEAINKRKDILREIKKLSFIQSNNEMILRHTPSQKIKDYSEKIEEDTYVLCIELIRTIPGHEKFMSKPGNENNVMDLGEIELYVKKSSLPCDHSNTN